jgi:hypothetical protein
MPSLKEREAKTATILGIIMFVGMGILYYIVNDDKVDKLILVTMTLCAILIGIASAKTFAIRYGNL